MTYLLCRNRVAGFAEWRAIFASHQATHLNAGLRLLWLAREGTDNAFFMFEVADMARARMFISDPDARKQAEIAGVIDGEYHFVEDAGGYGAISTGASNPFGC